MALSTLNYTNPGTGSAVAFFDDGSGNLTQAVYIASPSSPGTSVSVATSTLQTTGNSSLSSIDGKITACNTGAVTISAALPAGTNAIGKLAANSGVDIGDVDVTSVPADPFGANADSASATGSISAKLRFIASTGIPITGTVTVGSHAVTNAGTFAVQVTPATSGGLSVANFTSGDTFTALTNSAQAIKASAGQIYGWHLYNPNSSASYVIVYNIASGSVTVGTSTPALVLALPANGGATLMLPHGIEFGTAISCAATTTGGGNTAPSTALEAMFFYK